MENDQTNGLKTVDEYLATIADDRKRALLEQLRVVIKCAVPEANEGISYQMPTYYYEGILIYFAAWKNHWALYPVGTSLKEAFKNDLARYKQTKGSIHFPWGEPFPDALVTQLIKRRAEENIEKGMAKPTSKRK